MDLAASVQKVTEEIMLRITRELAHTYQIPNLCMAGGVALNCVANEKFSAMAPSVASGCNQLLEMQALHSALPLRHGTFQPGWKGAHPKRRLGRYARLISRTGVWPARDQFRLSSLEQASKCSKTRLLTAPWIVS